MDHPRSTLRALLHSWPYTMISGWQINTNVSCCDVVCNSASPAVCQLQSLTQFSTFAYLLGCPSVNLLFQELISFQVVSKIYIEINVNSSLLCITPS